jgi:serine/threonine protein kinase
MANKQDIITAIKNLDLFLRIPELKGAKPRLNNNGSPFAFAGGFNMVFQLVHNAKKWAFRVWHVPMGENKDRYVAISKYLTNSKLPYFADFIYDENGLLVNGELTDTIRMEWLDGILLKDYIEKHLNDKAKLESLANDFLEMTKTLREAKISHGDLQEGNILVDDSGKIRLVDYDSICIPEIEGQKELVAGLKGYQHPSRFKNSKASLKADYFSELIIYISILGIASKPELWDKYQVKDTCNTCSLLKPTLKR